MVIDLSRVPLALAVCWCLASCGAEVVQPPTAVDGVVDLSKWDFESSSVVLSGEWRFVWGEFIAAKSIGELRESYGDTAQLPAIWKSQKRSNSHSETYPTAGYASYYLEVHLPNDLDTAELTMGGVYATTAAYWEVYDAESMERIGLVSQGTPGVSRESSVPVYLNRFTDLGSSSGARLLVVLHVSNYRHARGGVDAAPRIGLREDINQSVTANIIRQAAVLGVLLIISLYHFVLFGQRREDKASLYFALFCATMALRHWIPSKLLQGVGIGWTADGYEMLVMFEYACVPILVAVMGLFFNELLPSTIYKRFAYIWCCGGGFILAAFYLVSDSKTISATVTPLYAHLVVASVVSVVYFGVRALRGNRLAFFVFLALAIGAVGMVNDILHIQWIIRTTFIGAYTFIAFVLLQSSIISGKFAWAFNRLQGLSEDLSYALERAQSADKLKGEILANLSHELRTPLNALINVPEQILHQLGTQAVWQCESCGQVYEDDGEGGQQDAPACPECGEPLVSFKQLTSDVEPERVISLLGRAVESGRNLNKTLSDILEFAKIQSGAGELARADVDHTHLLRGVVEMFHGVSTHKQVEIVMNMASTARALRVDEDQVHLLFKKIIENAIEYSPPNARVEIESTLSEDGNSLRISVSDQGPGIAVEDRAVIFKGFEQLDSGHTRAHAGVGLGLAIAAGIAEAHGTLIELESEVGVGSCFSVRLPLVPEGP